MQKLSKYMKKRPLGAAFFALLLALILVFPAPAVFAAGKNNQKLTDLTGNSQMPKGPTVESEGAILIDAKTGAILYGKNEDVQMWPASITKLMTALLTLENCELTDEVEFSYRATHELEAGATSIARTEGEIMTVEDCLYALLLTSANEVAQGLAEHVGGTIEDFADMMNERAKELGCTNTHFVTPSGLHKDDHVTTCHDMAIIMRALIQEERFLELETHQSYTIPPTNKHSEETVLAQKHALIHSGDRHYEGAVAGKTGYTVTAGHSLVTYAVRGDVELICVVMRSNATHYTDTTALLNYGFNNFTAVQLSTTTGAVDFARSTVLSTEDVSDEILQSTFFSEDSWLIVPKQVSLATLTAKAKLYEDPKATKEGIPFAKIYFYMGKTRIGTAVLMRTADGQPAGEISTSPEEETEAVHPTAAVTETEPETEESILPELPTASGDLKQDVVNYGNSFLISLGAAMHRFFLKLVELMKKNAFTNQLVILYLQYGKLFLAACASVLFFLILILVFLIRQLKKRFKKKKNPYISPRPKRPRASLKKDEARRRQIRKKN